MYSIEFYKNLKMSYPSKIRLFKKPEHVNVLIKNMKKKINREKKNKIIFEI